jgi:hypothetical protein
MAMAEPARVRAAAAVSAKKDFFMMFFLRVLVVVGNQPRFDDSTLPIL